MPPLAPDASAQPTTRLSWEQRRFLVLLGFPALGLTCGVTIVSTYLPVLVETFGGPLAAGLLVAGEGLFGLFVPILVGAWSDTTSTAVRDRLRLMLVASVVCGGALLAVGLVAWQTTSLLAVAVLLSVFYIAYFSVLAPYWALFADLVPHEQAGRSRSAEGTWRVIGSGGALIGGGLLLALGEPVPFVVGAALLLATVLGALSGLRRSGDVPVEQARPGARAAASRSRQLLRSADVRRALVCVALWGATLAGIRAFVVLILTVGLGFSVAFVSGVIFPVAAVGFVVAPVAGWLADRIGLRRVLLAGCVLYGGGLLVPLLTTSRWVLLVVPLVAAGAALVQTLDFALVMRLMPPRDHGAGSGLFGFARGLGTLLGPAACGAVVVLTDDGLFAATNGYMGIFPVLGLCVFASMPVLARIRGA